MSWDSVPFTGTMRPDRQAMTSINIETFSTRSDPRAARKAVGFRPPPQPDGSKVPPEADDLKMPPVNPNGPTVKAGNEMSDSPLPCGKFRGISGPLKDQDHPKIPDADKLRLIRSVSRRSARHDAHSRHLLHRVRLPSASLHRVRPHRTSLRRANPHSASLRRAAPMSATTISAGKNNIMIHRAPGSRNAMSTETTI